MTAFSSPVLDDFNRADATPPSGWSLYSSGVSNFGIVSNQVTNPGPGGSFAQVADYYSASTYTNTESYITCVSWPLAGASGAEYYLFARGQNLGGGSASAYALLTTGWDTGFGQMRLGVAGTSLRLSGWSQDLASLNDSRFGNAVFTDKIGFRCYSYTGPGLPGVMLEGWTYMAFYGRWIRHIAYLDKGNTITSAGYFGFGSANGVAGQKVIADDFGGGTVTPSPTMSDMPGLNGALPDPIGELVLPNSALAQDHPQAMQDPIAASVRDHLGMGADPTNHPELIGGQVKIR